MAGQELYSRKGNVVVQLYAVLDLKGGQVVHGVAGQRESYRPIGEISRLTRSSQPGDVARAFVEDLGISQAYVADLDAIGGASPDLDSLAAIGSSGMQIMIDAGVGQVAAAQRLLDLSERHVPLRRIVIGLESTADPQGWQELVELIGCDRAVLSLDLKDGCPLVAARSLADASAEAIAERAWSSGFRRLLVLDLRSVGSGRGPSTLELCRRLSRSHGWSELISGGGVRGVEDLASLHEAGCHGALMATALHRVTLSRAVLRSVADLP